MILLEVLSIAGQVGDGYRGAYSADNNDQSLGLQINEETEAAPIAFFAIRRYIRMEQTSNPFHCRPVPQLESRFEVPKRLAFEISLLISE